MDLTTAPAADPLRIYRYRDGLYAVDLITAALVEFDLFTWIGDHPAEVGGICAHFGFHERPADVLVTLCAANGWLERREGIVTLTPAGREFLTAGSAWNLAPYYASLANRPIARDFAAVLTTGRPASWSSRSDVADWHAAMEDETFARQFTAAMDCRGRYFAQALGTRVNLEGRRRLLDIGGGSGIYACSLAARYPGLAATVLDQPPVDRIAAAAIADRGFAGRVEVVTGNFLRDPLPRGHDVHLFSNVLHDWDAADVTALVAASAAALDPGGLLVIHDAFINATRTGPLPVAEYSALLMHSTQGKCYSVAEYERALRMAGFDVLGYVDTVADRGVMTARRR
jgi:predicted O-methyltransferase YrrM